MGGPTPEIPQAQPSPGAGCPHPRARGPLPTSRPHRSSPGDLLLDRLRVLEGLDLPLVGPGCAPRRRLPRRSHPARPRQSEVLLSRWGRLAASHRRSDAARPGSPGIGFGTLAGVRVRCSRSVPLPGRRFPLGRPAGRGGPLRLALPAHQRGGTIHPLSPRRRAPGPALRQGMEAPGRPRARVQRDLERIRRVRRNCPAGSVVDPPRAGRSGLRCGSGPGLRFAMGPGVLQAHTARGIAPARRPG